MIKKTQVRFFLLISSILFLVFVILFGSVWVIFRSLYSRSIVDTLDQIESAYSVNENVLPDSIIIEFTSYSPSNPTTSDYNIISSSNYSKEIIDQIIEQALENAHLNNGHFEDFYFKLVKNTTPSQMIVYCANMNEYSTKLQNSIFNTFLVMGVLFVIVELLIWSISQNIITPVKLAFDKQRQFVSDASHELKTPIAIISANAEILKSNQQDSPFVKNILEQTDRMDGLVKDLLTLAKINELNTKLSYEVFNLSEVVTTTTLPFDALAFENSKVLETYIDNDIEYKGDQKSVRDLLTILLDNAIKHSSPNGTITVTLKKEGKTSLTVFNTGSDVADNDSEKVFERFYRGDSSRSRDSGGSGLGLAIAKNIADTNNWKIHAQSKLHQSMTITVIF